MKQKDRRAIAEEWGKPKNRYFNFDLIIQYAALKTDQSEYLLSDKSQVDLDFDLFFQYIDRTSSAVGQQLLYNQMVNQRLGVEQLVKQEEQVQYFDDQVEKRIQCQHILGKLSKSNDYYFPYLMYSELPDKMFPSWIIRLLQWSMAISILLSILYPAAILVVVLLFSINLFLHYILKQRIGNFTTYFSRLSSLSKTIKKLLPHTNYLNDKKQNILSDAKHLDNITSKILFLKTDNLQHSELGSIFWFLFELLKIASLGEVTVFNRLVESIYTARPNIHNIYQSIGVIDIAISICSLRDGLSYYSIPTFANKRKSLNLKSLYHPLVQDCVPNDIKLSDKSLLLTGSNMAGKSTFIKAVNLNCLSAQTMNTSFSKEYIAPSYIIKTSIDIKDNLDESTSYYMEEVYSIGELIESSDADDTLYLFTIDEIFKGTNTIERISSAKAILEYLNRKEHLILISTHDIELTKLLDGGFDLYFFQESISDRSLSFDYKIKKGILSKSNAISILELAGYPNSIIDESRKMATQLINEKTGNNS